MQSERSLALAHRLREVFLDGQWIAHTNWRAQLADVSRAEATHRIGDLNTIAALTYHVNYYLSGLLPVFDGEPLRIRDQYSFNAPLLASEADWRGLVQSLLANAEKFADRVAQMPDEKLDAPFVAEQYGTYVRNLEGVVEHAYYHLGQLVLIRKMVRAAGVS